MPICLLGRRKVMMCAAVEVLSTKTGRACPAGRMERGSAGGDDYCQYVSAAYVSWNKVGRKNVKLRNPSLDSKIKVELIPRSVRVGTYSMLNFLLKLLRQFWYVPYSSILSADSHTFRTLESLVSLRQVLAELNCRGSTQFALKLKPATMLRHQTVIPTLKRAEYFNYRTIIVHCEKNVGRYTNQNCLRSSTCHLNSQRF